MSREAKNKRKENTLKYKQKGSVSDLSSDSNTTSSKSNLQQRKSSEDRILNFLFGADLTSEEPTFKKQRGADSGEQNGISNAQREKDLLRKLNMFSNVVDQIVDDAFLDRSCTPTLTNITIEYMVTLHCHRSASGPSLRGPPPTLQVSMQLQSINAKMVFNSSSEKVNPREASLLCIAALDCSKNPDLYHHCRLSVNKSKNL